MPEQLLKSEERRRLDPTLNLIVARLEIMHADVSDMKSGLKDLAIAITKLAVVEERLATSVQAQERAFKAIDGLKVDVTKVSDRVGCLEASAPIQKKSSDWVFHAVWIAAGAFVLVGLKKLGLA